MPSTIMRQERMKNNWTQAYVAGKIKKTVTSVSDLEHGKAKPSYKTLCALEDLFGMTHRKLFERVD